MQQNIGNAQSPANPGPMFNLDPMAAAKQMAALNSAGRARRATHGPSDDKSQSPNVSFATISSYQTPSSSTTPMSHPPQPVANDLPIPVPVNPQQRQQPQAGQPPQSQGQHQPSQQQQRNRQGFLQGLATFMSHRGSPLPPSITGFPVPNFDPNTTIWKALEPGTEVGTFKLCGKNIDLHRLFNMVIQAGGSSKLNAATWGSLAHAFELPPEITQVPNNPINAAILFQNYHKAILGAFEDIWLRNIARHQQARVQGTVPMIASHNTGIQQQTQPQPPQLAQTHLQQQLPGSVTQQIPERPISAVSGAPAPRMSSAAPSAPGEQQMSPQNQMDVQQPEGDSYRARSETRVSMTEQDNDEQVLKRKREESASNQVKRARTSSADESASAAVPTRRKIEYMPFVRELNTHGGRDLRSIDSAMSRISGIRPMHGPDEWGMVDIDGLTMSLKSRMPSELSFCFTTLTLLSTMRAAQPNTGFPLLHAEDLLDELLDFLEEVAFEDEESASDFLPPLPSTFYSHRELNNFITEEERSPFSVPRRKPQRRGPLQSPAAYLLTVLNALRNFSLTQENQAHLGKVPNVLRVVLKVISLIDDPEGSVPVRPASKGLDLRELLQARKDALQLFMNCASFVDLNAHQPWVTQHLFELISSFLVDPHEAVGPLAQATMKGLITTSIPTPPLLAEIALELLTKIAQPDQNRERFAKLVPQADHWRLFEALMHRMPVSERDYKISTQESWYSYMEKLVFSVYCLVFMASPSVKFKIRRNLSIGFTSIFLRMIKRYTLQIQAEYRPIFATSARRAIETMKLVDEGKDSFETPENSMPAVAFGMGYGEEGRNIDEMGNGLLGGYQDDITWGVLRSSTLAQDVTMFSEMESMARLG